MINKHFLDNVESWLEFTSNLEKINIFIYHADFKIDMSLPITVLGQHFTDSLSLFSFKPLIDKPTRITNLTHTIIDNIFPNVLDNKQKGLIYYISDYLPIIMYDYARTISTY